MKLEFVLRDEKVNIFSMIFRKQLILCKGDKFSDNRLGPYLLDCKRSNAVFKLSNFGKLYEERIKNTFFSLKYVAFIDSQIKFRVTDDVFQDLCNNKFFNVWDKKAPLKFFADKAVKEGYLIIFKVFEIENNISDSLLEKGRAGRNFYYKLSDTQEIKLIKPVISDFEFFLEKEKIIDILEKNSSLVEIIDSNLDFTKEFLPEFSISEENYDYEVLNSKPFSENYLKKIPKQRNIQSISWQRNPQIAKSILIKNNYQCQFESSHFSFISQVTNRNYVEAHHLIPMEFQGEFETNLDIPENIVTLCPNCHKQIHLGTIEDKFKILKKLFEIQRDDFNNSGIEISLEELEDLYI